MKAIITIIVLVSFSTLRAQFSEEKSGGVNNMMQMGAISVTIGGDFVVNGSFPAFVIERVDQFVTRIYTEASAKLLSNIQDPIEIQKIKEKLDDYSLRNLTLKRSSGEELKLDLLKFRLNGDFANNPYLKNDDVLIFQPSDLERNFFSVSGAVNKPGKFHFKDGDKLSDAIELAQGINKAYENVTKAEINRLSYDGEKMEVIPVDINNDYILQRGDRIEVVADETQKKEFSVTILGELKSPGKIPITKNSTTLKEVINKAGGFTSNASLRNSKIFTGKILPVLLESLYDITLKNPNELLLTDTTSFFLNLKESILYRMSNVTYEDREYFKLESQLKALQEIGSVDFSRINDENSEAAKYIVKDGDIIFIPPKTNSVYVFGQVLKPGNIIFKDGMDYKYYINQAGGLGEYAQDEEEIMIIKGDSHVWISPFEHKINIEEGDLIYIPREPALPFSWYAGQVGNYLSIVASAATIILLLVQFSK
jgi:protein involved in polysaccharide export with SLBB domain